MEYFPAPLEKLVEQFARLPGVGYKSAQRLAFHIINRPVEEVERLRDRGCTRELVSMQGLGYKEILAWLDGEISYEEAVEILKRDTRHFAKRQITWFKRERDVIWIDKDAFDYDEKKILDFMIRELKERKILPEL